MATLPDEDLQDDKKLQDVGFFRVLGRVTLITWMQENLKVFQVVMLQPCFEKAWLVWLAISREMRESTFTLVYWG